MRTVTCFALAGICAARVATAQSTLSCVDVIVPSDSGWRFGDVAEGRGGRLAWTDGRPGQFLLRDAQGKTRVVGRSGAGPGEFDRPVNLVWRSDTILASDWRMRRVQAFSDTGRLLRTMTAMVPGVWSALPDDKLVTIRSVSLSDESSLPFVLVTQRPAAITIDTVASFPNPAVARFERNVGSQKVRNQQPFLPAAHSAGSRAGNRFCGTVPSGSTTRLRCTDGTGRDVLDRTIDLDSRPIADAVYDSVVRAHVQGGNREDDLRSKITRPRYLPPVHEMRVDDSGEIWLLRTHRSEPRALWARLRPDGSLRDHITVEKKYRFIRTDGDVMWTATADPDGLETLHKCRIQPQ